MQVSCVRIHCPWLHPVTVISFARIHCSWVNTTNQSQGECLGSVNHSRISCWQCPSPAQVQCWLLPGQICSCPNCKQWRRTDKNNRDKKCPTIKKDDWWRKQCEKKELDRARETTRIHFRASFQRWRELQDLWGLKRVGRFSAGQVRTPALYISYSVF